MNRSARMQHSNSAGIYQEGIHAGLRVAIQFVLWAVCLTVLHSTPAKAAGDDSTSKKTQYFESIRLSPDGVLAVDTLGLRWRYQFDSTRWLVETRSAGGRREEVRPDPAAKRCTEARSIGGLQKSVLLGYEEYCDNDIISRGNVTIKGWAKRNVTSLTGRVVVNDGGRVDGNITAPEIDLRPGSDVRGSSTITTPIGATVDFLSVDPFKAAWWSYGVGMGLILVSGILILVFFRKRFNYISQCLEQHQSRSLLTGIAAVFSLPVVAVLLLFTLIGVVLIPLLPVVLLVAGSCGFLWVGCEMAIRVSKNTPRPICLRWGWIAILALLGLSWYLAIDGWQFKRWERGGQSLLFGALAISTMYIICAGLGSIILTRVGSRPYLRFDSVTGNQSEDDPSRPEIPDVVIPRYARSEKQSRRGTAWRDIR